jgi:hypothetical protein
VSQEFKEMYKEKATDFTRDRKLGFVATLNIMLNKSSKSLQNTLNESKEKLLNFSQKAYESITASAYTRARSKLNYTAFIALYKLVREQFYEDGDYQKFKGFRLLAVDGSKVILPNSDSVKETFTPTIAKNQMAEFSKEVVQARASVLYDVLNNIVIDATLKDKADGERVLAISHLKHTQKDDLIIFDRGYPSVELFSYILSSDVHFLIRLRRNSFKQIAFLFDPNCSEDDIMIEIKAAKNIKENLAEKNLPTIMKIRFVRIVLDNGEIEVLATSVLDHTVLQTGDFKALYHQRWGIETFFHILKNRLSLENFTGNSALAVQQDFYVTMFLSNYESLLVYDTNKALAQKSQAYKNRQKVNKSISFNSIKQRSFELFYSDQDIDSTLEEMQKLFMTTPTAIRPHRPNRKRLDKDKNKSTICTNSVNYHKRKKKVI